MGVEISIAIGLITVCLVLIACRVMDLSRKVGKLQKDASQGDVITQAVRSARKSVCKAFNQGHEMSQADKDARTVGCKELQERPAAKVDDAPDKMSMRKMEGIEFRMVRPIPAINAVFSHEPATSLLLRTETDDGFPIGNSTWVERPNGEYVLRITDLPVSPAPETKPINIVVDGPPEPDSGQFVEIETDDGESVGLGGWHPRPDGKWSLRITELPVVEPKKPWDMEYKPWLRDLYKDKA